MARAGVRRAESAGGPSNVPVPTIERDQAQGRAPSKIDPFQDLKRIVHQRLVESLGPKMYDAHMTQSELEQQVRLALQTAIADADIPMSSADRTRVSQEIADDILGYGPIEPLLRDPSLSEVMVNSYKDIFVERSGKLVKVDTAFTDEAHLRRTIDKIVSKIGRRVDETSPMCDARLPDGSRVNAIIPPLALDGSKLTIRKFSEDPYTVDDLINFGTLTPASAGLLEGCVRGPAQHPRLGRHRLRQDDDPQRPVGLHPGGRAHRHHRGRRRAPARPGPRAPARVPTGQHRGKGRGDHPRPREELPAHAARPRRRRRDP